MLTLPEEIPPTSGAGETLLVQHRAIPLRGCTSPMLSLSMCYSPALAPAPQLGGGSAAGPGFAAPACPPVVGLV